MLKCDNVTHPMVMHEEISSLIVLLWSFFKINQNIAWDAQGHGPPELMKSDLQEH